MVTVVNNKWVRSEEGWIAGVCQGLGEMLDVSPAVIRILWLISVLFFGVGLLIYILAAISFPIRGQEKRAYQPKVLGVCLRLADRFNMDIGLVRFIALLIFLSSIGTTILGYIILHFLVPYSSDDTFEARSRRRH